MENKDLINNKGHNEFGEYQLYFENKNLGIVFAISPLKNSNRWQDLREYKNAHQTSLSSEPRLKLPSAYFAAFAYSGQRTLNNIQLGAIQEITNSPFESCLSFDSTVRPQILLQWIANNRTQSALAKPTAI